jgi:hypothetical protein
MDSETSVATASVTPQALLAIAPLVTWLVRSGVGYAEFATALKPVFLRAAMQEQARVGGKRTDSGLALLAGLQRRDVRQISDELADADPAVAETHRMGKPTPANQVITRWLTQKLPDRIPFTGTAPAPGRPPAAFDALARSVSQDVHPRTVLLELARLGIVREEDGEVVLQRQAFVPDHNHLQARSLLAGSVADHLAAGVHNLSSGEARRFLEQSVFADGLSAASVTQLEQLASRLWSHVLDTMVAAAEPLCATDEPQGGTHRIRLGMFCYAADVPTDAGTPQTSTESPRTPS